MSCDRSRSHGGMVVAQVPAAGRSLGNSFRGACPMTQVRRRPRWQLAFLVATAGVAFAIGCGDNGANEETSSLSQALPCITCSTARPPPPHDAGLPRDAAAPKDVAIPPPSPPPSGGTFTINALGRMCLDFGAQAAWAPGVPVTLYWCNGSVAQWFDVVEVPGADHDFNLRVGTGVGNDFCIGAQGGPVQGAVLEIEDCNGSAGQQFAFDGDALYAGIIDAPANHVARQWVGGPLNDVTNSHAPM